MAVAQIGVEFAPPRAALRHVKRIGVFDSGVGGLTVVRAVRTALPHEHLVYLGDTARVPYGNKSAETVRRYAENAARFLLSRDIKLLPAFPNAAK